MPLNIVDRRDDLPRHPKRKWKQREERSIMGVCFHQSLGPASWDEEGINAYHITPTEGDKKNHLSADGAPRIAYYALVREDGTVVICNELTDITWSQGGAGRLTPPLIGARGNTNFLGVCFAGDFDGGKHKGKTRNPTDAQIEAADLLWKKLSKDLGLGQTRLFGHYHFGKDACPGKALKKLIEGIRTAGVNKVPKTIKDHQTLLVDLGYNLGKFGSKKDGVDGDWGKLSKDAMSHFAKKHNLSTNISYKDPHASLELAVAALTPPDGPPTKWQQRKASS